MMKDMINLDDSNKELSVSKEKIDILIREIKAKGEKVIKVYNSFSQVDSCGYSLTQLYKLTEQNINYKDNEYRFFTTMTKCSMFQWNNHDNVLELSKYILNEKLLTVYFKYIKFKNNKIFSVLRQDIKMEELNVIYEDNHIIVVKKIVNIPSQSDKTGDMDMLTIVKQYIKEKYNKPGNVYVGLVHRLDRPVGGVMVFAKTSKAASRLSNQVREKTMKKQYLAVVDGKFSEQKRYIRELFI